MKCKQLNKDSNNNLIIFFNGWGFDEQVINCLDKRHFDIFTVYDYKDLSLNFSDISMQKYEKKYLICWSMGVYAANLYTDFFANFDKRIAINGTGKMIDDTNGIPQRIYDNMIEGLSEMTFSSFIAKSFNISKSQSVVPSGSTLQELKDELISLKNIELKEYIRFDKVIISAKDRIVPAKNQVNYWKDRVNYLLIDAPHCPFYNYGSIEELIW